MWMGGDEILAWLHLCSIAGYFGAQFAVIYMLMPAAERAGDEPKRRAALIAGFRFYDPFSIGTLGVAVISGAMLLTDLKASMKLDYFNRIGGPLSVKLALAFLLIFLQTYIAFGLAFRIGRQEEVAAHGDGEPFTVEQVDGMLRRIRALIWGTIVLAAAIIFVSLIMTKRAATVTETTVALRLAPSNPRARNRDGAGQRSLGGPAMVDSDKRRERVYDIQDRDEPEGESRQFAQKAVAGEADVLGGLRRLAGSA